MTPITGDVITGAHLHDDYDVTNNNNGDRQKLLFVVQSAVPPPTCPPVHPATDNQKCLNQGIVRQQSVAVSLLALLLALGTHERGASM